MLSIDVDSSPKFWYNLIGIDLAFVFDIYSYVVSISLRDQVESDTELDKIPGSADPRARSSIDLTRASSKFDLQVQFTRIHFL